MTIISFFEQPQPHRLSISLSPPELTGIAKGETNSLANMGKSFQKIHACSVGNFGDNTDKIPQWIKANGGVYVKEINDSVTHLVASEAAVKKNVEAGKQLSIMTGQHLQTRIFLVLY